MMQLYCIIFNNCICIESCAVWQTRRISNFKARPNSNLSGQNPSTEFKWNCRRKESHCDNIHDDQCFRSHMYKELICTHTKTLQQNSNEPFKRERISLWYHSWRLMFPLSYVQTTHMSIKCALLSFLWQHPSLLGLFTVHLFTFSLFTLFANKLAKCSISF